MDRLARLLYWSAWFGLPLGIGLQLLWYPPETLGLWLAYGVFALYFLFALTRGPRRAPKFLVHGLGAYLLFELWRAQEDGWVVGYWSPALYLVAAFAYPVPWALAASLFWGALLLLAPPLWGRELGPYYAHFALSQPVLLALTLLLARFREFYGRTRFWREQALTCPLTGLPNRRALEMALEREAARVERGGKPFSLVLLDLDDFKRVNDEKGHPEGDRLLKEVARYLVAHVRQGDLVGRWGGEEFAILLPETDALQATRLAERLREGLKALGTTASFGVASYRGDLETLYRKADEALYRAKRGGKDRVARYTDQGSR
ncbi:diguanylate cyclase [Thermus sp. 2.9]|uniref:GGDEF domain-containing protein n=1 Tax=Thermus TaxID=270 RepID=UPI000542E880|nr:MULTISPECIES: GGDEF domain-containing protein [Thermus]KHG66156.1 diguanylate cyclase [Thermus sp. 2.9]